MKFDIPLLQDIMDQATSSAEECGLQLAIYDHGELAVDLVSGYADRARKIPVTKETLFPIFSSGKGVMTTAFHMLAERQKIRYANRVADFWPEYGCNGKEATLVWHALTHRAAVSTLPQLDSRDDMADWELMVSKLAQAVPDNTPGEVCAYHGLTYTWLIGELASRAAGVFFKDFMQQEIFAPLNIEKDIFFGTDAEAEARLAEIEGSETDWCCQFFNRPKIRRGFIPAANGVATAAALARIYASISTGVENKRLLSPETVENAAIVRRAWSDPLTPSWAKFGLGWVMPYAPESNAVFGQGGALGAEAFADRERGIAVGFVKNHVTATHPVHPVRDRLAEALGMKERHW